jgi:hypothetical protein
MMANCGGTASPPSAAQTWISFALAGMPPETLARRRAYEAVARAAREMLEEMDAIERG